MNRRLSTNAAVSEHGRQPARWRRYLLIVVTGVCLLVTPATYAAELDPGVPISRANVSSGGGISSGGVYVLNGSVSLNRGDGASPSGGAYAIDAGLWLGVDAPSATAVYLPMVVR